MAQTSPETPPQPLPRLPTIEEIIPTIVRHIDTHRKLIDRLVNSVDVSTACFENVIRPLVELENAQAGEQAVIAALKYFSPVLECQHTGEEAEEMWQQYSSIQRHDLFVLVNAVKARGESLDYESQKLLDRMLLEFEEYGYGLLDDAGIQRRLERVNRIEQLSTKFLRNLREHIGGELFTPEELDGVPAKDRGSPNPDGKEFFSYSKYFTIMRWAHNQETRKRMLLGNHKQLAENVPIFREVILLRDKNARELRSMSHATAKLPYRIAKSTEWVDELLENLTETLLPYGREDFERIRDMKKRHLKSDSIPKQGENPELMPWDYLYYSSMLEKEVQVDHAAISEYFPLRHTFSAMLEIVADCLQLRFDPISKEEAEGYIWHEDVQVWKVWDGRSQSKGDFIGYLFVDALSRPNKYKGAQSVNLQPGYLRPDDTRVYPANTVMCNFGSAAATGYLLTHNNIITLFHELGHSVHDLVSRTRYARFHGFQVALEFGEGIGMTFEQFCWIPDELKAIGRHYTRVDPAYMEAWLKDNPGRDIPPERIPDKLLANRLGRRGYAEVNKVLGLMILTTFDMAVHNPTSHEALLQLDERELYKGIYEKLKFRRLPDPSYAHVADGLLLAGYDAGYYAYVCAEIIAANLFRATFAENPRSQDAWEKFRRGILEYGGSRNELELLEEFLGDRPTNPSALLSVVGMPTNDS